MKKDKLSNIKEKFVQEKIAKHIIGDKIALTEKEIKAQKRILKSRKNLLKKLNKDDLEIWNNNSDSEFSDKKRRTLQEIIDARIRFNRFLFHGRNFFVTIFVFFGLAAIFSSSYFVGKAFYQSSFVNSFNSNYESMQKITLNIGQRPGETKAPDAYSYASNIQQGINALFSSKIIDDKKWNTRDVNVQATSDTKIIVSGPKGLISELLKYKNLWTTSDQNLSITDMLGDDVYIGMQGSATPTSPEKTDKTQIWVRNLIRWEATWFGQFRNPVNYNQQIENDMIQEIITRYVPDVGKYDGTLLSADAFSDSFSSQFGDNKSKFYLNFQIADSSEWKVMTQYIYNVERVISYNLTYKDGTKVFKEQNKDDAKSDNNRYIHQFLMVWYGGVPSSATPDPKDQQPGIPHTISGRNKLIHYITTDPITPDPKDQLTNEYNFSTFFDPWKDPSKPSSEWVNGFWGNHDSARDNNIRWSYLIEGLDTTTRWNDGVDSITREGQDPLLRDTNKKFNTAYHMMTENNDKHAWKLNRLLGVYGVDFDNNFKDGVSASSLDFKNNDSSSTTPNYNNFSYWIASGDPSTWYTKDNSKDATTYLANYLRNSLGQFYSKIVSIVTVGPLLFSYQVLIFLLIGVFIVFMSFLLYLIIKYRLLGFIAVLASIAFLFSILTTFTIFQTNFQPSMIVVVLLGLGLYMVNLILLLKYLKTPFIIPEDKTFFETYLIRSKKIFFKILLMNLPIFLTLYLVFNLVLTVLQGSNILWISYIFSFLIIFFFYLILFPAFLFQNNKKFRSNPDKLGIQVKIFNQEQFEKLHFYNIKSEEDELDKKDDRKNIYFYNQDDEKKILESETKKINKGITKK